MPLQAPTIQQTPEMMRGLVAASQRRPTRRYSRYGDQALGEQQRTQRLQEAARIHEQTGGQQFGRIDPSSALPQALTQTGHRQLTPGVFSPVSETDFFRQGIHEGYGGQPPPPTGYDAQPTFALPHWQYSHRPDFLQAYQQYMHRPDFRL